MTWCFIDNLSPEMKQDNHLLGIQFLLHTFQTTWKCFRLQWGMREASLLWHVRERIAFLYHFTKVIEQGFLFSRSILYWHLTATWEEILCWRKERYIREFLLKLSHVRWLVNLVLCSSCCCCSLNPTAACCKFMPLVLVLLKGILGNIENQ